MASKSKWKKRLKKIGKVAAIAGAAALAGKLASKRRSASIADMDDAGIGVTHPASTGGDAVTNVVNPNLNKVAPAVKSSFKPRVYPGTVLNERGPKIINPNEDNPYVRIPPGGMRTFKKGGKVTGIAKRGFGRALMKGKK